MVMETERQTWTFDLPAAILTGMCAGCQGEGRQEMLPGPGVLGWPLRKTWSHPEGEFMGRVAG